MATGTFTARNQLAELPRVTPGEVLSITLTPSGSSAWVVMLETTTNGFSWNLAATYTSAQTQVRWENDSIDTYRVRLRCERISSPNTIAYTIVEVPVEEIIKQVFNGNGDLVFELTGAGITAGGPMLDVRAFGAVGDGVTDDYAAMQAAFNAASALVTASGSRTAVVLIPAPYVFATGTMLTLPINVSLQLNGNIKAIAAMEAVVQTPLATVSRNQSISGTGEIACNDLANVGIDLQYFEHFRVSDILISTSIVAGLRLGNSSAASTSYEAVVRNVRTIRRTGTIAAGSIGCHVRYATDGLFSGCLFIAAETGITIESNACNLHRFTDCHVWTPPAQGTMVNGFVDNGIMNTFTACYADSCSTYGFVTSNQYAQFIGCTVYNGNFGGGDNTLIGIHMAHANPNAVVMGLVVYGQANNRRVAADLTFASGTTARDTCTILGLTVNGNVVITNGYRVRNNQAFSVGLGTSFLGSSDVRRGSGSPEGVLTAPIGSMFLRSDGGTGSTLYIKETGTGNTGWVAK